MAVAICTLSSASSKDWTDERSRFSTAGLSRTHSTKAGEDMSVVMIVSNQIYCFEMTCGAKLPDLVAVVPPFVCRG